ncbi:MAG: capsular biosynthesis protein [Clostridiales bacterium]|nr:capsular biosynthesis protein [Clostridiales bacterium]MCC8106911.1 capsular biosynthesis protein [Clostridiales bacterium]
MEGIYDIHCHILPGVDDGSHSIEETCELLRREYEDGVRTIIVTPHYRLEMFEPGMARIYRAFWATCDAAADIAPDLKLYMGCEFHANMEMVETLKAGGRPTMAGSRYVLTEFRESTPYSYIKERVAALRSGGYRPLIAHAERYECMRKEPERAGELSDLGARIQVNAGSLLGDMGHSVRRYCQGLLEEDLIWCVGSDAHNLKDRTPNLGKCAAWLEKKFGTEVTRKVLIEHPAEIVRDGVKM